MFGKTKKELKEENENLIRDCEIKGNSIAELESFLRTIHTEHVTANHIIGATHAIEIAKLTSKHDVLKDSFDTKVSVALAKKIDAQEKTHTIRMARLEKEYAEKIAKCDSKLENDKASYRKYLRSEFNREIDGLRAENAVLKNVNVLLAATSDANLEIAASAEGTIKAMTSVVEGLTKALPTISASFTTPEIPANTVTVGSGNKS